MLAAGGMVAGLSMGVDSTVFQGTTLVWGLVFLTLDGIDHEKPGLAVRGTRGLL